MYGEHTRFGLGSILQSQARDQKRAGDPRVPQVAPVTPAEHRRRAVLLAVLPLFVLLTLVAPLAALVGMVLTLVGSLVALETLISQMWIGSPLRRRAKVSLLLTVACWITAFALAP
jgi:hypothetical protein